MKKMVPLNIFPPFSVINAWTICRVIGGNDTLLDFFISISRCLISATSDSNDKNQEPPKNVDQES